MIMDQEHEQDQEQKQEQEMPLCFTDHSSLFVGFIVITMIASWTQRLKLSVFWSKIPLMAPSRKLQTVAELNDLLHKFALEEIRHRHPDATVRELRFYLASRWIPRELMKEAFGGDPEEKGY